ncbi:MAG TPA: DUF3617 family protein [Acidobacteriaceae bacterium]|nr:DUF3617 family protein [Acidobacteriaceae bacterium]
MLSKLILSGPLVLILAVPQTQNSKPKPMDTAPAPLKLPSSPPIKMGLWEATSSVSTARSTMKSRACVTPESYQEEVTRVPDGCTVTNRVVTGNSLTADVSCTMPNGVSGTGHVQANFTGTDQVHTTIQISMAMGGRTTPINIISDAHFVQTDCGDIPPGASRDVD